MYMNWLEIKAYLGGNLMSKCSISKRLAQVKPGTLHAGVDLALEKNIVVVITEKAVISSFLLARLEPLIY